MTFAARKAVSSWIPIRPRRCSAVTPGIRFSPASSRHKGGGYVGGSPGSRRTTASDPWQTRELKRLLSRGSRPWRSSPSRLACRCRRRRRPRPGRRRRWRRRTCRRGTVGRGRRPSGPMVARFQHLTVWSRDVQVAHRRVGQSVQVDAETPDPGFLPADVLHQDPQDLRLELHDSFTLRRPTCPGNQRIVVVRLGPPNDSLAMALMSWRCFLVLWHKAPHSVNSSTVATRSRRDSSSTARSYNALNAGLRMGLKSKTS